MPEREPDGNFVDIEVYGVGNMWNTAERLKKSYELHADFRLE